MVERRGSACRHDCAFFLQFLKRPVRSVNLAGSRDVDEIEAAKMMEMTATAMSAWYEMVVGGTEIVARRVGRLRRPWHRGRHQSSHDLSVTVAPRYSPWEGKTIGIPSVCPSVHPFISALSFEPTDL